MSLCNAWQPLWVLKAFSPPVASIAILKLTGDKGPLVLCFVSKLSPAAHVTNHSVDNRVIKHNAAINPNGAQCLVHFCPSNQSAVLRASSQQPNDVRWLRHKLAVVRIGAVPSQRVANRSVIKGLHCLPPHVQRKCGHVLAIKSVDTGYQREKLLLVLLTHSFPPMPDGQFLGFVAQGLPGDLVAAHRPSDW